MTVLITHTPYNFCASTELLDGSVYHLEAHLELAVHPQDKRAQIVFFVFDGMRRTKKKGVLINTRAVKDKVFQALMNQLQEIVSTVVIIMDNKWFELSKARTLYYLKEYKLAPRSNTQMDLIDFIEKQGE